MLEALPFQVGVERVAKTIDELAQLSGVSRATVSRVLNGGSVSPATKQRVQEVLDREDYRPNVAARSLASGRSGVIGLVIHVDPHDLFQDPYFGQLLQGISGRPLRARGRDDALAGQPLQGRDARARSARSASSTASSPRPTTSTIRWSMGCSLRPCRPSSSAIAGRTGPRATSTSTTSARPTSWSATWSRSGRRRIGHITGLRGTVAAEDRLTGYRRAMDRAGLSTDGLIIDGDFHKEAGRACAEELLAQGVDAIFCANDAAAAGALALIKERGRRVPDDVALGGFDDLDFAARLDPPLTTIRQGVAAQGAEAARVLFQLLGDPDADPSGSCSPRNSSSVHPPLEVPVAAREVVTAMIQCGPSGPARLREVQGNGRRRNTTMRRFLIDGRGARPGGRRLRQHLVEWQPGCGLGRTSEHRADRGPECRGRVRSSPSPSIPAPRPCTRPASSGARRRRGTRSTRTPRWAWSASSTRPCSCTTRWRTSSPRGSRRAATWTDPTTYTIKVRDGLTWS